jgi:hypothetical protein
LSCGWYLASFDNLLRKSSFNDFFSDQLYVSPSGERLEPVVFSNHAGNFEPFTVDLVIWSISQRRKLEMCKPLLQVTLNMISFGSALLRSLPDLLCLHSVVRSQKISKSFKLRRISDAEALATV